MRVMPPHISTRPVPPGGPGSNAAIASPRGDGTDDVITCANDRAIGSYAHVSLYARRPPPPNTIARPPPGYVGIHTTTGPITPPGNGPVIGSHAFVARSSVHAAGGSGPLSC